MDSIWHQPQEWAFAILREDSINIQRKLLMQHVLKHIGSWYRAQNKKYLQTPSVHASNQFSCKPHTCSRTEGRNNHIVTIGAPKSGDSLRCRLPAIFSFCFYFLLSLLHIIVPLVMDTVKSRHHHIHMLICKEILLPKFFNPSIWHVCNYPFTWFWKP